MQGETGLRGAVAVVTGALGRLGPIWTSTLEEAGATVVGLDLEAGTRGSSSSGVPIEVADVTDRSSLESAHERIVERFGAPTVLVNNAGVDQPPDAAAEGWRIEDVPESTFRQTTEVNLTGAFSAMQVFGTPMRDLGRGSIINIGSLYATVAPDPSLYDHMDTDPPFLKPPAYGASKAGLVNLTKYFARLWGPSGVRVNSLSPGGVLGDQDDEFRRKYCARVPLGRMAEVEDLRGPLLFLAGEGSRYLTGHDLLVDGGYTA